jgi:hypothetical protein
MIAAIFFGACRSSAPMSAAVSLRRFLARIFRQGILLLTVNMLRSEDENVTPKRDESA